LGPPVLGAAALGLKLRQSLPPAIIDALDNIGSQIEVEILEPLLRACIHRAVGEDFRTSVPKVQGLLCLDDLHAMGRITRSSAGFSALTIRSFQESEKLILAQGTCWIGQEASLNALQGLASVTRIARAATVFLGKESPAGFHANISDAERWANSVVAYVLAFRGFSRL
jgi:hypothetical protein